MSAGGGAGAGNASSPPACLSGYPSSPLTLTASCAVGFFCPNLNASLPATWPQYCPPTPACSLARLEGQWCEPQGAFEPGICAGGRYCPSPDASLECPEGSYCVRGSTAPHNCEPLSFCPPGTQTPTFFGGILMAALIDAALVAAFVYLRCFREPALRRANLSARRRELVRAADVMSARSSAGAAAAGTEAGRAGAKGGAAFWDVAASWVGADGGAAGARSAADNGAAVTSENPLRAALAEHDDVEAGAGGRSASGRAGAASGGAFLRDAIEGWLVQLPAGVSRDRNGRVRTLSMRRSSGAGATDSDSDGESEGAAEEGLGVEVAGAGRCPEGSRAGRVARMAADAAPPGHSGSGALSPLSQSRKGSSADLGASAASAARVTAPATTSTSPLDRLVSSAATLVLEDGFRRCNAGLRLGIDFRGLRLTLPPPLKKTILSDVTGRIAPGRVTAIMGPSGAGKTTFLSVLMGKVARTAGTLLVNGRQEEMTAFKSITGFVPQDDTMLQELTVRENIAHSARVRLPRHGGWDAAAISRLVDAVIEVLGLHACADTAADRISGGQRKRTNIGMELAMAPAAIFLDEPTSGLDATAALEVCNTLRAIANLGLTVVAVVHQPRAEIFRSFDDLLLLAPGGKTVYMGPQEGVVRYFAGAGFAFGLGGNPADDLLDFIAGRDDLFVAPADLVAAQAATEAADRDKRRAAAAELTARRRSSVGSAVVLFESLAAAGVGVGDGALGDGGAAQQAKLPQVEAAAAALAAASAASAAAYRARRGWVGGGCTGGGGGGGASPAAASPVPVRSATALAAAAEQDAPPTPSAFILEKAAAKARGGGAGASGTVLLTGSEVAAFLAARWTLEVQRRGAAAAIDAAARGSGGSGEAPAPDSIGSSSAGGGLGGGGACGAGALGVGGAIEPLAAMMADRGASFAQQFVLCHNRSLLQQFRRPAWLVLELAVSVAAGGIMGLAAYAVDELYSGVLRPPYTVLSPAPMETMLPSLGLYINIAIGVAGSPAAVRTFGEERDVFLREHSGGHNLYAYFAAKNVSVLYRQSLAALHFAGTFAYIAKPTAPFAFMLAMVLGIFFGVYGLSTLMSMLVDRANAALLGTIASLVIACMCGFGPNLKQGREWGIIVVQDLSYSRWANELFLHAETLPYRDLFLAEEITADIFGYGINRPALDIGMMLLLGLLLRLLALGGLRVMAKVASGDVSVESVVRSLTAKR